MRACANMKSTLPSARLFVETSVSRQSITGRSVVSADTLLETIRELAAELHPSRPAVPVSLDNRLEQDYGFDSLGRVELFLRIEHRFGVSLTESVMASAETSRKKGRRTYSGVSCKRPHAPPRFLARMKSR